MDSFCFAEEDLSDNDPSMLSGGEKEGKKRGKQKVLLRFRYLYFLIHHDTWVENRIYAKYKLL